MTRYPDLFAGLAAPFTGTEVKTLDVRGRKMSYITARTAMNRLDAVLGPENWRDEYRPGCGADSVVCRLAIRLPDGEWLAKEDAGGAAGMADAGDDDKSTFSDAFKRAAVKFGVGRYLYRDGVPSYTAEPRSLGWVHGDDERLPSQARPSSEREPERNGKGNHPQMGGMRPDERGAERRNGHANGHAHANGTLTAPSESASSSSSSSADHSSSSSPRTGKALYRWAREMDERHGCALTKYLTQWGKLQDFPARMVDWEPSQAEHGHREALRKLEQLRGEPGGDG